MKNLHLMPMNSTFDDDLVEVLNENFLLDQNLFVHRMQRKKLSSVENSIVAPEMLNVEYINEHYSEYHLVLLHSLFLSPNDILKLSDEAAQTIVWCVWGHDLYSVPKKRKWSFSIWLHEAIHSVKKVLRGTYLREYNHKRAVAKKISLFHAICIGFPYDEIMVRKKYGDMVPVKIAPYFSDFSKDDLRRLKESREQRTQSRTKQILIGHSGFEFLQHEKYLKLFSRYSNEDICINMVLSYGASQDRIAKLVDMANRLFGEDKVRVVTEMMPKEEYFKYISSMDIAVFPYLHQSALDNTKIMAFVGVKMYFDPKGVLFKGFTDSGVKVYNCREIGKVSFKQLCSTEYSDLSSSPLFDPFDYEKNVSAWKELLCSNTSRDLDK